MSHESTMPSIIELKEEANKHLVKGVIFGVGAGITASTAVAVSVKLMTDIGMDGLLFSAVSANSGALGTAAWKNYATDCFRYRSELLKQIKELSTPTVPLSE